MDGQKRGWRVTLAYSLPSSVYGRPKTEEEKALALTVQIKLQGCIGRRDRWGSKDLQGGKYAIEMVWGSFSHEDAKGIRAKLSGLKDSDPDVKMCDHFKITLGCGRADDGFYPFQTPLSEDEKRIRRYKKSDEAKWRRLYAEGRLGWAYLGRSELMGVDPLPR